jgi:cytochrome b6-f complex iron-sulfur subunit
MNRIAASTDVTAAETGAEDARTDPSQAESGTAQAASARSATAQAGSARAATAGPTRRRVVTTGALGALAATALAACGGDDETPATQPTAGETGSSSAGPSGTTDGGSTGGDVIAKVADVPVGGAIAGQTADGTKVILCQPQPGKVVAFDSRCPHQGCTVAPAGDKLSCPCHGSTFQTADGSLINGPATKGLEPVAVTVSGDDVVAG